MAPAAAAAARAYADSPKIFGNVHNGARELPEDDQIFDVSISFLLFH